MYQFLNNKNKKNGWIRIVTGIIVLILFIGILNLSSSSIRSFFYFISSPIRNIISIAGKNTASIAVSVLNFRNLQKENDDLKTENQRLLAQMALLQDSSEQDQAVKDILACSQQENFNLVLANITGLDSKQDFILIDKGKDDGISENMAVVSQQKVLFGKVFKVYKSFSQVMLISNKNSILDVKIEGTDSANQPIYGVAKGRGGLAVFLDLVPTDSEINTGDVLVTSALEGIFPKDLLVGKVISKEKNDAKPFQTATVDAFFDPKKVGKLFVITNYRQEK